MSKADLKALSGIWENINVKRKLSLLEDLEYISDTDTHVCFDNLCIFALHDSDPFVRASAIRLLWECQDKKLIPTFIGIMENESEPAVRGAAAFALGAFIYLGEMDKIPQATSKLIEDKLIHIVKSDENQTVRRKGLEALGYSNRDEVPGLIQKAYESMVKDWLMSALFAMGRSADILWEDQVVTMIRNSDNDIQFEAIRAAGNLELQSARELLLEIFDEYEDLEKDTRSATIFSLGQIGGADVKQRFMKLLEEIDDDDDIELLEDALEYLAFNEGADLLGMFDIDTQGKSDSDEFQDFESGQAENDQDQY